MENLFFQTSLIAAFVAGMVALFAPCCITFLLPAYLGSIFKEKEKILLMTFVFGLGIFVVLLPAVLGVAFISQMLFRFHDSLYQLGALVMFLVAILTFLGIKMPIVSLKNSREGKSDILSIFVLGVFAGITSACCAPVLIGILTLTFLSPSFAGAIIVGAVYVLGMITPLVIISLFLENKTPQSIRLRKKLFSFHLFGKEFVVIMSNLIAASVFLITALVIIILTFNGGLAMGNEGTTGLIQTVNGFVIEKAGNSLLLNFGFILLLIFTIYLLLKKKKTPKEIKECCHHEKGGDNHET